MNSRRQEQLMEVVSPLLAPGEQVQVTAAAGVGTVTVKRQLATAVAVGVATGGLLTAIPAPRQMYIAVTDRRILFFDGIGKPDKQLMDLPRQYVRVSPPQKASPAWRCASSWNWRARTRPYASRSRTWQRPTAAPSPPPWRTNALTTSPLTRWVRGPFLLRATSP